MARTLSKNALQSLGILASSGGAEGRTAAAVLRRNGQKIPTISKRARKAATGVRINPRVAGRRPSATEGSTSTALVPFRPGGLAPRRGSNLPVLATSRNPIENARQGKGISRLVAGGIAGTAIYSSFNSRSGRPVDRVTGRPTGVYGY